MDKFSRTKFFSEPKRKSAVTAVSAVMSKIVPTQPKTANKCPMLPKMTKEGKTNYDLTYSKMAKNGKNFGQNLN